MNDWVPTLPQAWAENKVPMMQPSGDMSKDRKVEQKVEGKKKSQAEIEQEMAALQYTNPLLLEVRKVLETTWVQTVEQHCCHHQVSGRNYVNLICLSPL